MRTSVRTAAALLAALTLSALSVSGTSSASDGQQRVSTAALEQVTDFGSNPGALSMYRYTPDGLGAGRPVVVVLHGCTQNAATYFDGSGWQQAADKHGFTVVAPQQETANNASRCFNWFQSGDTERGSGEALSVRQMVDRTVQDLGADPSRVYVTGLSAGGGMTSALLAAYPDTFAGGGVIAGLPHGCADSLPDAFGCMNPGVTKSPPEWGDLARAAHPGYEGPRPRVSVWHGTADTTVAPRNATESVKQWTNVLGADQTADATHQLPGGTTQSDYQDGNGQVAVRSYQVDGMGHGTPVKPGEGCGKAGAYFLDTVCSTSYLTRDWGLSG
ncbi:PHB depolymerase family esterase [Streptomyces sp. NBC_01795]|uniref:extracellular catalytic domain type 1 short-chain-length polyhydroxyalkanoate depolymerase n=1 Tax=unclassified Streptomyces TaxID=2593676 RepID=UPI002DD947FC|nr:MULTISPECIES: PHB depolymerase family esterase [unclassified Streptomyces]WSA90685.1 PHB depolymerase family esterase [Streptomyces sp. NBC_01795]WSB75010.1 PHB depolymerase family esterase [Streptomyces sp. NBC_01775]WSS16711.1 PHB depolymerase family esterase [Streptomyces sp. NBC_01186]